MDPSTSNNLTSNKKRVQFKNRVKVFGIEKLAKGELEIFWYMKKDYQDFKASNAETIELMASKNEAPATSANATTEEEDVIICTRGLEPKTNSRRARMSMRKAVLNEQSYQRNNGCKDLESLAQISKQFSELSVFNSLTRGLLDEQYVHKYMRREDRTAGATDYYGRQVVVTQSSKASMTTTKIYQTRRRSVAGSAA